MSKSEHHLENTSPAQNWTPMNTRALVSNANVVFSKFQGLPEESMRTGRGGENAPFVWWMSVLFVG